MVSQKKLFMAIFVFIALMVAVEVLKVLSFSYI